MGNGTEQNSSETTGKEIFLQQNNVKVAPVPDEERQQFCVPRFEYNSGIKIEIPAHLQKPLTMQEEMQRFIRNTVSHVMEEQGLGTLEEEDDFEDDFEDDLLSGYEVNEMEDDYEFGPKEIEEAKEGDTADGPPPVPPAEPEPRE